MRKRIVATLSLALFLMGFASLPLAAAQEAAKGKEDEVQLKPTDSYKVEFTVNELDSGKKINSRSYSMLLRAVAVPKWTEPQALRVESTVSFGEDPNRVTLNLGMNIDCRLLPMENGKIGIRTSWIYNSVGGEREVNPNTQRPVRRVVRSDEEAVVPMDKTTVISEMDDVASTHRFIFEVKVTKINP